MRQVKVRHNNGYTIRVIRYNMAVGEVADVCLKALDISWKNEETSYLCYYKWFPELQSLGDAAGFGLELITRGPHFWKVKDELEEGSIVFRLFCAYASCLFSIILTLFS